MSAPRTEDVEAVIREVTAKAILPRFRSLGEGQVEEKSGAMDLVTVADREAEELLTEGLEAMVPGSKVIGEEAVSAGEVSLDRLHEDGPFWLVDPVDGTYNFVQGEERFGVMVAYLERREVLAAWIYLPVEDVCLTARKGEGAFADGERLGPWTPTPFSDASGDYSPTYVEEPFRSAFLSVVEQGGPVRQGRCSAYAYSDLARGRLDYVMQYVMTPWDHAAGQLIVEEAGGRFGFLDDGSLYTPLPRNARPMLITAQASTWDTYAGLFREALERG